MRSASKGDENSGRHRKRFATENGEHGSPEICLTTKRGSAVAGKPPDQCEGEEIANTRPFAFVIRWRNLPVIVSNRLAALEPSSLE